MKLLICNIFPLQIDFTGNRLSMGLDNLKVCSNLKHLIFNQNRIRDLEALEPLKCLEHLTHLDISMENPGLGDQVQIRMKIFELLPNLQYLDGTDIDGNDEEEEGLPIANGLGDDVSDGDDELEDEEGEEEEEDDEESDGEVETGLPAMYDNGVEIQDEDDDDYYNEDASDDEDEDDDVEEDEIPEHEQSTRGKKRKLDDGTV